MKGVVFVMLTACFILLYTSSHADAASVIDAYTLHTQLLYSHNPNIRPIQDQSKAIQVNVSMYIKTIQEFDEVNEKFSFVAAVTLMWIDETLIWDPNLYNGLDKITVSYEDIWVPEMTLASPSSRAASIGRTTDRIRIEDSGLCVWTPANLIESTCGVDVRSYPFDMQSCTTSFVSLGYKNTEVNLTATFPDIQLDVYSEHALWDLVGSKVSVTKLTSEGESEVQFTVNLKRNSAFVVVNIILPISFLSLLNVLVFMLVPESGERIGYCITTLLAIAVYMTIVNDMLPHNSKPISLISYKLLVDLLISGAIVIVTVINMKLWSREDNENVPKLLKFMYKKLACRSCRKKKVGPRDVKDVGITNEIISMDEDFKKDIDETLDDIGNATDDGITWKRISHMIDMIALLFFTVSSILSSMVYVIVAKHTSS